MNRSLAPLAPQMLAARSFPIQLSNSQFQKGSERDAATTNRHTPRKRGNQYAAAFRLDRWRLGVLDRLPSRAMTA